ncbi:hypothetical protein DL768_011160 [Monosporascus sp. mg162]|nr:hypothetical protein DL768_011160 [Monosporascus sp. mg162]
MATAPTTSAVIYTGPKDWDKFKDEFKTRAKGYNLWDYIDPDQNVPWPVKPTAPDMTFYPERRVRQTTQAASASSERRDTDKFNQFVIEDISAIATHAALVSYRRNVNLYTARPPRIGDGTIWHLRLGHPGPEVIGQLQSHTRGVRLKGLTTVECQACGKAKAKRQIRSEPREGAFRSGQRIAIDFTDFEEDPEGYRYVMFATDRGSEEPG